MAPIGTMAAPTTIITNSTMIAGFDAFSAIAM
jgi:hypothetical protein